VRRAASSSRRRLVEGLWYIRGWGPSGYAAWSEAKLFTMSDPPLTWARKRLPDGHPFVTTGGGAYWTQTPYTDLADGNGNQYFVADPTVGFYSFAPDEELTLRRMWCVRSGATAH
jgi:hypothetical protein